MDNDAVARVLAAVGSKHTPKDLDREKLRRELEWEGTWYRTSVVLREKAKRDRRLETALKAAKRFQQALAKLKDSDLPLIGADLRLGPSFTEKLLGFVKQAEAALMPPTRANMATSRGGTNGRRISRRLPSTPSRGHKPNIGLQL